MSNEIVVLGDVLALVGTLDPLQRRRTLGIIASIRDLDDAQYGRILRVLDLYYGETVPAPTTKDAPSDSKVPVKERALALKAEGLSYVEIAAALNREGYSNTGGKSFNKMSAYHLAKPAKAKPRRTAKPKVVKPSRVTEDPKGPSLSQLKAKALHALKSGPKAPREIFPVIGVSSNNATFRAVMGALLDAGKVTATGATSTRRYQIAG